MLIIAGNMFEYLFMIEIIAFENISHRLLHFLKSKLNYC